MKNTFCVLTMIFSFCGYGMQVFDIQHKKQESSLLNLSEQEPQLYNICEKSDVLWLTIDEFLDEQALADNELLFADFVKSLMHRNIDFVLTGLPAVMKDYEKFINEDVPCELCGKYPAKSVDAFTSFLQKRQIILTQTMLPSVRLLVAVILLK